MFAADIGDPSPENIAIDLDGCARQLKANAGIVISGSSCGGQPLASL